MPVGTILPYVGDLNNTFPEDSFVYNIVPHSDNLLINNASPIKIKVGTISWGNSDRPIIVDAYNIFAFVRKGDIIRTYGRGWNATGEWFLTVIPVHK